MWGQLSNLCPGPVETMLLWHHSGNSIFVSLNISSVAILQFLSDILISGVLGGLNWSLIVSVESHSFDLHGLVTFDCRLTFG